MSKNNKERLFELRHNLEKELPQVLIYTDFEGTYLHIIYNGESVCKILLQKWDGYSIEFEREFVFDYRPSITWRSTSDGVVSCIRSRIRYYDEKKGQKNMTKLEELRDYLLENIRWNITTEIDNYCKLIIYDNHRVVCYIKELDGGFNIQYVRPYIFDGYNEFIYQICNGTITQSINHRLAKYNSKFKVSDNDSIVDKVLSQCKGGFSYAHSDGRDFRHMYPIMKTGTINITVDSFIKDVIFNDPATIVFWTDGTKTVVKCQPGETFDPEKGLAMAISKRVLGNDYGYYETFAKHIGRYNKKKFNKALEEAKKIPPDEVVYNGRTYRLTDEYTVKSKEK